MTDLKEIKLLENAFNTLELIGIILMLLLAFSFQILLRELPCPLCLLQRIGFFGIAFGFLLNLRFGLRPSHYALALLSALLTAFIALRQIALHIVPGTGAYGDPFLGFHLYTWSFIFSMLIVIVTIIMMSVDRQYLPHRRNGKRWRPITHALFFIITVLLIINIAGVIFECGFGECPDNPVKYEFII